LNIDSRSDTVIASVLMEVRVEARDSLHGTPSTL